MDITAAEPQASVLCTHLVGLGLSSQTCVSHAKDPSALLHPLGVANLCSGRAEGRQGLRAWVPIPPLLLRGRVTLRMSPSLSLSPALCNGDRVLASS